MSPRDELTPVRTVAGPADAPDMRLALAIADVNWFTTQNLFRDVDAPGLSLLALRCMDYRNGWRQGIYPWSRSCRGRSWGRNGLLRDMVLPSGWMKQFPRVGMRPISRAIRRFWNQAAAASARGLVLTYPHYLYLRNQLRPDRTLYYNLDDYALYWPGSAQAVNALERQMVLRADATVCVARYRADVLRAEVPEAAGKIHHIPHGTPAAFLSDRPFHQPAAAPEDLAGLPRPLLGYIGSIEGRVDWALLAQLADAFPGGSLVIVGKAPGESSRKSAWFPDWTALAARANVHTVGWKAQSELPSYYSAFDVVLIPYRTDDPFNRACCPTKIADCLGTGRPIVATALPECRLYPHLFDVAETPAAFLDAVRSIVAAGSDDGRAALRHNHAKAQSCRAVAEALIHLLLGTRSGTQPGE